MYRSDNDPSVFFKRFSDGTQMTILLHVDDAVVFSSCSDLVLQPHLDSLDGRFRMKLKKGMPDFFLGLNLSQPSPGEITVSCKSYIRDMGETYLTNPIESYPSAHTPSCSDRLPKLYEEARSSAKTRTIDPKLEKKYRSLVGSLQYAASTARPDILYTVGLLGRALTFPTPELYDAAMRVLGYLSIRQ